MSSTMYKNEYCNCWKNERGELHREDGPAVEYPSGCKFWWVDGKLHRIEGPACIWSGGYKLWYVSGKDITPLVHELISKSPFSEDVHLVILAKYFSQVSDFRLFRIVKPFLTEKEKSTNMHLNENGDKIYSGKFDKYRYGIHRIEGPAIEFLSGDNWWYIADKDITKLVRELLARSPFNENVNLGILAEYWAERGDFRLLDIVQPYLAESK